MRCQGCQLCHACSDNGHKVDKIKVYLAKKDADAVDGLLGQDFLRSFAGVRIDYREHVVELEQ